MGAGWSHNRMWLLVAGGLRLGLPKEMPALRSIHKVVGRFVDLDQNPQGSLRPRIRRAEFPQAKMINAIRDHDRLIWATSPEQRIGESLADAVGAKRLRLEDSLGLGQKVAQHDNARIRIPRVSDGLSKLHFCRNSST